MKAELSRAAIVDRALDLADVEGLDALTVRRLAQSLGVTPMALYWHVRNKDELLAAIGDRFFDELDIPPTDDWVEHLRVTVRALVASLRRHPGSAHLAGQRVLQCEAGRELAERTLALLRAAGFSPDDATSVARHAMQTATMLVCEEAGSERGEPAELRADVAERKRLSIASLPADRYPNLIACATALTHTADEAAYYRLGIELFVNGARSLQPVETQSAT